MKKKIKICQLKLESQKFKTDTDFPWCKKEKQQTKASARTGDEEIRTSV